MPLVACIRYGEEMRQGEIYKEWGDKVHEGMTSSTGVKASRLRRTTCEPRKEEYEMEINTVEVGQAHP